MMTVKLIETMDVIGPRNASDPFATLISMVGVILLVILLIQREAMRSSEQFRNNDGTRALNVLIVPLLVAFVVTVSMRLIAYLYES